VKLAGPQVKKFGVSIAGQHAGSEREVPESGGGVGLRLPLKISPW